MVGEINKPVLSEKKVLFEVEHVGDDVILHGNFELYPRVPSLEDDSKTMSYVCDQLIRSPSITKLIFFQKRDYEYDEVQTEILKEIALLYNDYSKKKGYFKVSGNTRVHGDSVSQGYNKFRTILISSLKSDPIGTYVQLIRLHRHHQIILDRTLDVLVYDEEEELLKKIQYVIDSLASTKLISLVKSHLAGYKLGDRSIYRLVFNPIIKPDFMYSKLLAAYPKHGTEIANYSVGDIEVVIFELPDTVQYLYHVTPPEFKLTEELYEILDLARKIMSEHKPEDQDFVDPDRMREVFFNVGADLLQEIASTKNVLLSKSKLRDLTAILVRYSVGFGLIEVLLTDDNVQDIAINSPYGKVPIFLVHGTYDECKTNIIPSESDAESWASKLRMMSGRPLDEANPILDTEIHIPGVASARVSVITSPLASMGLSYSFRRQRDKPWTFPLFIKNRMINPIAAGLLSFLIDGNKTLLIAGTRGSGKSSFLSSIFLEIMRKYRIITIEDTLELPTTSLRNLGYNIVPMQVASALSRNSGEFTATEGIRSTLRLGDSAIFVGEVRSKEAIALFESMRVSAGANVAGGTFHADSTFGIYDRCVNAIGIPNNSFKALDIAIIVNPIRSADGLHKWRRVTAITEIRKDWQNDPLLEHGFVDLLKYNTLTDQLEPTDALINGDSEMLKAIAANVKDWAGNWDALWDNILLRAKYKERLVKRADEINNDIILEAEFSILANDMFHKLSNKVIKLDGYLNSDRIYYEWNRWLESATEKYIKLKDDF